MAVQFNKIVTMHLVDEVIYNEQHIWLLSYFHTNPTPYTLTIKITLSNNQSNTVQYNFIIISITITLSYLGQKLYGQRLQIFTWLVCDWPCTRRDFPCHLSLITRTHWARPATSNAVAAACGATKLCFQGSIIFALECNGRPVINDSNWSVLQAQPAICITCARSPPKWFPLIITQSSD
jgi:hypothetical protein